MPKRWERRVNKRIRIISIGGKKGGRKLMKMYKIKLKRKWKLSKRLKSRRRIWTLRDTILCSNSLMKKLN
jgi:hypothetical protein